MIKIDKEAFRKGIKYIIGHPKASIFHGKWKFDHLFSPWADGVYWSFQQIENADAGFEIKPPANLLETKAFFLIKWLALLGVIVSLRNRIS